MWQQQLSSYTFQIMFFTAPQIHSISSIMVPAGYVMEQELGAPSAAVRHRKQSKSSFIIFYYAIHEITIMPL